jgi:hypothetical protein
VRRKSVKPSPKFFDFLARASRALEPRLSDHSKKPAILKPLHTLMRLRPSTIQQESLKQEGESHPPPQRILARRNSVKLSPKVLPAHAGHSSRDSKASPFGALTARRSLPLRAGLSPPPGPRYNSPHEPPHTHDDRPAQTALYRRALFSQGGSSRSTRSLPQALTHFTRFRSTTRESCSRNTTACGFFSESS